MTPSEPDIQNMERGVITHRTGDSTNLRHSLMTTAYQNRAIPFTRMGLKNCEGLAMRPLNASQVCTGKKRRKGFSFPPFRERKFYWKYILFLGKEYDHGKLPFRQPLTTRWPL